MRVHSTLFCIVCASLLKINWWSTHVLPKYQIINVSTLYNGTLFRIVCASLQKKNWRSTDVLPIYQIINVSTYLPMARIECNTTFNYFVGTLYNATLFWIVCASLQKKSWWSIHVLLIYETINVSTYLSIARIESNIVIILICEFVVQCHIILNCLCFAAKIKNWWSTHVLPQYTRQSMLVPTYSLLTLSIHYTGSYYFGQFVPRCKKKIGGLPKEPKERIDLHDIFRYWANKLIHWFYKNIL